MKGCRVSSPIPFATRYMTFAVLLVVLFLRCSLLALETSDFLQKEED